MSDSCPHVLIVCKVLYINYCYKLNFVIFITMAEFFSNHFFPITEFSYNLAKSDFYFIALRKIFLIVKYKSVINILG